MEKFGTDAEISKATHFMNFLHYCNVFQGNYIRVWDVYGIDYFMIKSHTLFKHLKGFLVANK